MVNASIMMTLPLLNLLRQKKQPGSLISGSLLYNIWMYKLILKIACRCYRATFQCCSCCNSLKRNTRETFCTTLPPLSSLSSNPPLTLTLLCENRPFGPKAPQRAECGTCTHPQNNMFFFCSLEIEGCCSCCPVLSRPPRPIKRVRILGICIILTRW